MIKIEEIQSKEEKERNKDIKTLIKLQRKYGRGWILDLIIKLKFIIFLL